MSYIQSNLLPDEKIVFSTKKHKIIFIYPIILTIVSVYAFTYMQANPILYKVAWAPYLVTVIFWVYSLLEYHFSEFAVTDKRVMMREGFFNRHANEVRLRAIAQVNIDQGIIGQLLNFGTVSINAFGASDAYTLIANPMAFQRAVNAGLEHAR